MIGIAWIIPPHTFTDVRNADKHIQHEMHKTLGNNIDRFTRLRKEATARHAGFAGF